MRELAEAQAGVVSRAQLVGLGVPPSRAVSAVDSGRWRRLFPGVYAVSSGQVPPLALTWAAVLYAGRGAVAGRTTALWLAGLLPTAPDPVHVAIPADRRVRRQPGVRIHLDGRLPDSAHPAARPPRIRVEEAVLDVTAAETSVDQVLSLVFRVVQHRLTTAGRLRAVLDSRPRHRWRSVLREVLADADEGVHSPLERRYAHRVERAHGLPRGERNRPEWEPPHPGARVSVSASASADRDRDRRATGRWYRDVRYRRWGVVVELDGREAHPLSEAFRDRARDNRAVVTGEVPLRYGWREVVGDPCGVAAEVARVLAARGWPGAPVPCSPRCPVPHPS